MDLTAPDDDSDEYRMLADHMIELFNPPDKDEAEVSILMDSLSLAAKVLRNLPCHCDVPGAWDATWDAIGEEACCSRCLALGRFRDREIQR